MSFEHDQTMIDTNMDEISSLLTRVATEHLNADSLHYAPILEELHTGALIARETAKQLALSAVTQRIMTRKEAAEIIGVHPITISRWLTAATVESAQQIDEPSQ